MIALNTYEKITKEESYSLSNVKWILLAQVVVGHAVALSIAPFDNFSISSFSDYFLLTIKLLFSFGRESAYLFIFFSGFFTAPVFLSKIDVGNFMTILKKRIKRIYPVFTFSLLFTFLFDILGHYILKMGVYTHNLMNYEVQEHLTLWIFIKNFFSLQPTFSITFGSNGPLWTLGYLLQFFIVAIIFKAIFSHFNKTTSYLLVAFCTLILCFLGKYEFIILYLVWHLGLISRMLKIEKVNIFLPIIAIGIILCVSRVSINYVSMILSPMIGFLILYLIKNKPNLISYTFINKFPDLSYAVYALHMPILFFMYGGLIFFFTELSLLYFCIYISSSILTTLVLSILVSKLFKRT